jgi:hypothetical protein
MRARSLQRLVGVASFIIFLFVVVGAQMPKGLEGTWKLNLAKSKFSPGPAPKSMTLTYTFSADGVKIVSHVVPADGAAQHWEMMAKDDGKEYPVTGHPNADSVSLKGIEGGKGQSTFKKGGKVTMVNVRSLSADGKTLTIDSKGTDEKGQPVHNVQVFER